MDAERLAATFVELADTLVEDFDLIEFLYRLVERCTELLEVSAVGLMFADARGHLQVMASSSEEMGLLELFQLQNHQGPCLEAYTSGEPVDCPDLTTAGARWPIFAPEAVRVGFNAVHALPMRLRTETIGALNLFHTEAGALRELDARIGQAMVDVATIGLIQVEVGHRRQILITQLQTALDKRILIEQAKGILAERRHITPAAAFTALRAHARNHNQRLTELANAVIDGEPAAGLLLDDPAHPAP